MLYIYIYILYLSTKQTTKHETDWNCIDGMRIWLHCKCTARSLNPILVFDNYQCFIDSNITQCFSGLSRANDALMRNTLVWSNNWNLFKTNLLFNTKTKGSIDWIEIERIGTRRRSCSECACSIVWLSSLDNGTRDDRRCNQHSSTTFSVNRVFDFLLFIWLFYFCFCVDWLLRSNIELDNDKFSIVLYEMQNKFVFFFKKKNNNSKCINSFICLASSIDCSVIIFECRSISWTFRWSLKSLLLFFLSQK